LPSAGDTASLGKDGMDRKRDEADGSPGSLAEPADPIVQDTRPAKEADPSSDGDFARSDATHIGPSAPRSTPPEQADDGLAKAWQLTAGTMVHHFGVLRAIGRGATGEVYLARDTKLGRRVALKLLIDSAAGAGPEAVRTRLHEARATAVFNHPNIVNIHSVDTYQGHIYLALEYLDGQNLRERIAVDRPSVRDTIRIGHAVAEALAEAHAQRVLHRDLKPANVIIAKDGRPRVVDFGLAARARDRDEPVSVRRPETAKRRPGTPAYLAPELWQGQRASTASDVWALGTMLFEMLAGVRPFRAKSLQDLQQQVTDGDAVSLPPIDGIPAPVESLVNRALERGPDKRPTAREIASTLEEQIRSFWRRGDGDESPFRGLSTFGEQHAHAFFGRDAEIEAFVERLRQNPILPVIGPSGAGKSSFVQAGVMPRLREHASWRMVSMRPGRHPFARLAAELHREWTRTASSTQQNAGTDSFRARHDEHELREQLYDAPGLLPVELRELAESEGCRVLLFVDQLEELYTLVEDDQVRRRFMRAICEAADDAAAPVRAVFTLRDDFLVRLAEGQEAREVLGRVTVIRNPDPDLLKETLTRPVEAIGYRYEDPELVDEMVAAVDREVACLPLLQFSANKLWERRDSDRRLLLRAAYEQMGGVAGALARHADGLLDGLTPTEREQARRMLLRLVTAEGTRAIVPRMELLRDLGDEASEVLERLTKGRLLSARKGDAAAADELELVHESLLSNWGTFARWLDDSRGERAFFAELSQTAKLWKKRGRRPEELWQDDALAEALRTLQRHSREPPAEVQQFIDAARRRQARRARRKRVLIAATLVSVSLIALVLAIQKREADEQRLHAERRGQEAEKRRGEALWQGARSAHSQQRLLEARAKLRMALEIEDSQSSRALWWQLKTDPVVWRRDLSSIVYDVSFSKDGKTIVAACQDGAIYLFDVHTLATRVLRGHEDQVIAAALSPDGDALVSGAMDGQVWLWDLRATTHTVLGKHSQDVMSVKISRDGRAALSAGRDGTVRVWDLDARGERARARFSAWVFDVAQSPDGKRLVAGTGDGSVHLLDAEGTVQHVLKGHTGAVSGVSFSPDGKQIASIGDDKTLRLWSVATTKQLRVLEGHTAKAFGLSFSPDGKLVASIGQDKTIRIFDVALGQLLRTLQAHNNGGSRIRFSPDGKTLVSSGYDRTVRLWSVPSLLRSATGGGHTHGALASSFGPGDRLLASGGYDKMVRIWDVKSGRPLAAFKGHLAGVEVVRFSPDGKLVASGAHDKTIRLWQVASGQQQRVLEGHGGGVIGLDFSPDGRWLASASNDKTVRLWEVASGLQGRLFAGHTLGVKRVTFSPDGRVLAAASHDKTIRLWDTESGKQERMLEGHSKAVLSTAFSPDGQQLASLSGDRSLRLWDLKSGQPNTVGHIAAGRGYSVAFHPNGKHLGTTSSDGSAWLWDLASKGHRALRGHRDEVNDITFSRNGELAATTSDDTTVRLWRVDSARPYWHAPVLLGKPPMLLSHQGWSRIDRPSDASAHNPEAAPKGLGARLRGALKKRALWAATVGTQLCLQDFSDGVELWDLATDKRLWRRELANVEQLLPTQAGCAIRTAKGARLLGKDGAATELVVDGKPTAIGSARVSGQQQILVAAAKHVHLFDETGKTKGKHHVGVGVAAVTLLTTNAGKATANHEEGGHWLAVGFEDGNIELAPMRPDQDKPSFTFERVPSSPPSRMMQGPMGSLIVGYANGVVGLWDYARRCTARFCTFARSGGAHVAARPKAVCGHQPWPTHGLGFGRLLP